MTGLRKELEAAALAFAHRIADAVESAAPSERAPDEFVDQHTCAPLSPSQYLRLVRNGHLPGRKVPHTKRVVVRREDFDSFLASPKHAARIPRSSEPASAPGGPAPARTRVGEEDDPDAALARELGIVPVQRRASRRG